MRIPYIMELKAHLTTRVPEDFLFSENNAYKGNVLWAWPQKRRGRLLQNAVIILYLRISGVFCLFVSFLVALRGDKMFSKVNPYE